MRLFRLLVLGCGLVLLWQLIVGLTGVPDYILPGPLQVGAAIWKHAPVLMRHAATTTTEILVGLILGAACGAFSALAMVASGLLKRWLLPVLVISQAIPVFALAPLLVLWFGYGMASKVAMAVLIIYFPVTAAFFDGLRRTDPQWLELARIMNASPWAVLCRIRVPAAMPSLASGLRVATAAAPIGAVVGEWVGASSGLGFYMLHANARMQIDTMFAALCILAMIALTLYFTVDWLMSRLVFWQYEEKGVIDPNETN